MPRRRPTIAAAGTVGLLLVAALAGCPADDPTGPLLRARSYGMGFTGIPSRPDSALVLATIDLWKDRADRALLLVSPPWSALLAGFDADTVVRATQLGIVNYYRALGLRVDVSIDPTDGLDRSKDAPELVAAGRSIAEPAIQDLYRSYVVAMDTLLQPDYLGIASETNLVRGIAPPAIYQGVKQAAHLAALDVRAVDASVRLVSTVQVEVAWGALAGNAYVGIAQDRADFPFIDALGLSSYPYLGGVADPDSLPLTYYSRLVEDDPLPVLVIEGGWPSVPVGAAASTPEMQRRYIVRHARLLDEARAVAWFQLTFTDLDLTAWPAGIAPFARLGLVTEDLVPKPALAAWDSVFARPLSSFGVDPLLRENP